MHVHESLLGTLFVYICTYVCTHTAFRIKQYLIHDPCVCVYVLTSRDLKFSSFMVEFKNGKDRAKELLSNLPHIIPHRQVRAQSVYAYIHPHVYIHTHTYSTYIHTCIQYIRTYVQYIYTHLHTCKFIHTHIDTCIHTYILYLYHACILYCAHVLVVESGAVQRESAS